MKPVGVVHKYTMSGIDVFSVELLTHVKENTKLYLAPQTKPLSDDEIDKVASIKMNQILMDLIDSEDWNKGCTKQHLVNFARAIEERHGIK